MVRFIPLKSAAPPDIIEFIYKWFNISQIQHNENDFRNMNEMNNYDFSNIGKMGWGGLGSGGEDEYLEMFPLGKKLVEKERRVMVVCG